MDRPLDVKRILVEEIRAAIAETAPAPGQLADGIDPATADARGSMRRAGDVLMPSIPPGARLEALKRLAIRALRFLWRNQSAFNAWSLAASTQLADGLDRLRAEMDELGRRAGIQESRLTLVESAAPASGGATPAREEGAVPSLPPGVYSLFEERFRGGPDEIARGQSAYLELLRDLPGPVLDVGSGRGEFLRLLASAGIPGSGIDSNPVSVAACRNAGLDVEEGDALTLLAGRLSGGLGAVVAFQVVEHWAPDGIFRFLREARRVLAPGGVVIAETINSDSVSAMHAFYLDPTHVRPVPPDALRFLAEAAGFVEVAIEYRSPLPASERLEESSENDRKLNALLFGPQDYAMIGWVPPRP